MDQAKIKALAARVIDFTVHAEKKKTVKDWLEKDQYVFSQEIRQELGEVLSKGPFPANNNAEEYFLHNVRRVFLNAKALEISAVLKKLVTDDRPLTAMEKQTLQNGYRLFQLETKELAGYVDTASAIGQGEGDVRPLLRSMHDHGHEYTALDLRLGHENLAKDEQALLSDLTAVTKLYGDLLKALGIRLPGQDRGRA